MDDMQMLMAVGLAALVVALLGYALFYNAIARDKKGRQRMQALQVGRKEKAKAQSRKLDDKQRRKSRENALKNVEEQRSKGKSADKITFALMLQQAGMTVEPKRFHTIAGIVGLVCGVVAYLKGGLPIPVAIGIAVLCGVGIPRWYVGRKRKKRLNAFSKTFPNAIDVIVRGVKSGLPLNDCLRIIATDSEEPVRGEFRRVIEATQMGITVPEACERLYRNVPTPETNFFAIVIHIQSSAGGNLSEALGNLSKVLRERKKMGDKIQSFSSEAKTSTAIIGALPLVVALMVGLTNPAYLEPLWNTSSGNKTVFFCALSMLTGVLVMKKMINFKF